MSPMRILRRAQRGGSAWRAAARARRALGHLLDPESWADARCEFARRISAEPPLPPGEIARVLVLCHGNVCRSPFAAALLARSAPRAELRSAGLAAAQDGAPDPMTTRMATRWDIDLSAHRTRPVRTEDVDWAQLILVMQGRHARQLQHRFPEARAHVRLLGAFLGAPPYSIGDPWGRGEREFARRFEQIDRAVQRLAPRLGSAT